MDSSTEECTQQIRLWHPDSLKDQSESPSEVSLGFVVKLSVCALCVSVHKSHDVCVCVCRSVCMFVCVLSMCQ